MIEACSCNIKITKSFFMKFSESDIGVLRFIVNNVLQPLCKRFSPIPPITSAHSRDTANEEKFAVVETLYFCVLNCFLKLLAVVSERDTQSSNRSCRSP